MQLKSFIAAASLTATTANALLLPPDVSGDDIITTLPVPSEVDGAVAVPKIAEAQTLQLNCPGCPVRVSSHRKGKGQDGNPKITTDIPSHLELDFSIEPSDGVDRLMLNGFELYPKSDPFKNTLTAALVPELKDKDKKTKRPHHIKGPRPQNIQNLGFSLRTHPVPTAKDDALELIMVDLQIIEVGNAFVDGIPNVEIKLIKTPDGKLMIGGIEATASETIQKTPMDKQEECTTLLCKWTAMVKQQLRRLRSGKHCGGRPSPVIHDESNATEDGDVRHPGHSMAHHKHKHSWGQLFKNIASHILLPVAIGIMAGVTASIFGMMVGTFIVFLWRTFVRRSSSTRRRRGHSFKASHKEAVAGDEKAGLMAHQEESEVPSEVPPAYVEEGVVAVDDKKPEDDA